VPLYWYAQPRRLAASAGLHRFVWDVHYQPLASPAGTRGLPISSVPGRGAPAPASPWAAPGTYTVRLTAGGRSYTQPIEVRQDPRVRTPAEQLRQVYALTDAAYRGALAVQEAAEQAAALREQPPVRPRGRVATTTIPLAARVLALAGAGAARAPGGPGGGQQAPAQPQ
jgi:hypothetical protein